MEICFNSTQKKKWKWSVRSLISLEVSHITPSVKSLCYQAQLAGGLIYICHQLHKAQIHNTTLGSWVTIHSYLHNYSSPNCKYSTNIFFCIHLVLDQCNHSSLNMISNSSSITITEHWPFFFEALTLVTSSTLQVWFKVQSGFWKQTHSISILFHQFNSLCSQATETLCTLYINILVQNCSISSELAREVSHFCTWWIVLNHIN